MGCKEHVQNYYAARATPSGINSLHSLYPLLLKLYGSDILKLYGPIWEILGINMGLGGLVKSYSTKVWFNHIVV